jgi:hypothetical protein
MNDMKEVEVEECSKMSTGMKLSTKSVVRSSRGSRSLDLQRKGVEVVEG